MYLYIEMWNVTTKWMKLSREKRKELMDNMHQRVSNMKASGVENLGWARNDEHTPYRSDYRYMTVWKMPSIEEVKVLESNLEKVGWYNYFSQANSRGQLINQDEAINFLIDIQENSTSVV
ncbi:hypothetical protein G3I01_05255 [Gramella sp. MT6]|uniref:DUF6616 family protein n=1 Tax=Gramella sp. MT6 TaxID=2705471 RepID=UPI001C601BBE|nr:DUF6616 family protein [Gramella sp. MT6]QYA24941.1 hypothetical protein G3I01_05255 [Gramella sp. MT6]